MRKFLERWGTTPKDVVATILATASIPMTIILIVWYIVDSIRAMP